MYKINDINKFPKTTGVYKIFFCDSKSNKIYIGSASGEDGFYGRWKSHISQLKNNNSGCNILQKAFNKYFNGDNLIFEIVEECAIDHCLLREQYYIDKFNTYINGYNARPKASNNGGLKMKDSTKKIIHDRWKSKRDILAPIVTKLYNENKTTREICLLLNISRTFLRKIFIENNINVRKDKGLKKVKIYQYSLDGNLIEEWDSINKCSKSLNLNTNGIKLVLKGKCSKHKNYYFSYNMLKKDDIIDIQLKFKNKLNNKGKKYINIKQYNKELILINEFIDISDVILFLGIKNKTALYKSINTDNLYKDFLWKSDIIK